MAFKKLLQEIEDKFNEVNNSIEEDFTVEEPYYLEISIRDAKKALDVAHDNIFIRRALRDSFLNMDGSNVYKSKDENIIEELINIFNEYGIEITDSNVGELAEASTSAGAGGYLTPNAFGHEAPKSVYSSYGMKKVSNPTKNTKTLKESDAGYEELPNVFGQEAPESAILSLGMQRVNKVNKNTKPLKESNYKTMMSEMYSILEEGKYNDIKNDPTVSPKKKVNYAIAEVYTKLYEIEKIISRNMKLKNEMNVDNRMYWKSTKEKLSKLSERLNRVSSYLKNLSA
jgi:hypothetical protein